MDTPPKTNSSPLKIGHPKRKLVFQPSIFRCHVSFRDGYFVSTFQCRTCPRDVWHTSKSLWKQTERHRHRCSAMLCKMEKGVATIHWVFPKNRVTPKSSILIGFSIINHPFWGFSPYFWFNTHYLFTNPSVRWC